MALMNKSRSITSFAIGLALLGLGLAAVAAGCAGAPEPRFYTLDMTSSGTVEPAVNVDVDRLRAHDALTRVDILVKKSPTQIEYYALDRWAASLSELVPEKLRSELGSHAKDRPTFVVNGEILAFEQVDRESGADAHIKLDLTYHREGESRYDTPLFRKQYELFTPADSAHPSSVVEALSKGLEMIAAEIAHDASALLASGG